jgi:ATP-dependent Clp protease adapter protein ClpS
MKIKHIIRENTVVDRKPAVKPEEIELNEPGGFNIVILNDNVTPYQVVVEAIMHAVGLSEHEAFSRMMQAHQIGWGVIATYASRDIAETVANKLEQHARANTNWDHYRPMIPPRGYYRPWPLTAEVMEAGDAS